MRHSTRVSTPSQPVPYERTWVRHAKEHDGYVEPVYEAIVNGWPVEVTDTGPRTACFEREGLTRGAGTTPTEPFEVVVRGVGEVRVKSLQAAWATAEAWARSLPPGAREGEWTAHPDVLHACGLDGCIRVENGHVLEICGYEGGWGVYVDGEPVAHLQDPGTPGVLAAARDIALVHASNDSSPSHPRAPATTRSRSRLASRLAGVALATLLAVAVLAGALAGSAEARRHARDAERTVDELTDRLEQAGFVLPTPEGSR